jgi:diguanylate cyclase (GGDEF)-like protein
MKREAGAGALSLLVVSPKTHADRADRLTKTSPGRSYRLRHASNQREAAKLCVGERPECVLVMDFGEAPHCETVLARFAEETGHVPVPVVVVTDAENERRVTQTLKIGAQDCLLIDELEPAALERSIRHAIARKRIEERLVQSALYDALTGLPNRTVFFDRLHVAIQQTRRTEGFRFAVAFLDLDDFKIINDTHGHLAGDRVLAETARRLRRCLRPGDTVARFGGDEFVVLLDDVRTDEAALRVAERIVASLEKPVVVAGVSIRVGGSVGFSFGTSEHASAEEIIEEADAAMYRAKTSEDHVSVYLPRGQRKVTTPEQRPDRVIEALKRGELRLHYQAIYSGTGQEIVAYEALLRWMHPEDGLIAPDAFLREPAIDGVAEAVEAWVIRRACADVVRWKKQGIHVPVSVNVSLHALIGRRLEERIAEEVAASGISASDIGFEIAIDGSGFDGGLISDRIRSLAAKDHPVTLEGFGGEISLELAAALPVDAFKLKRRITALIDRSADHAPTLRRLVAVGRALGGLVIAQGVETEHQREAFKRIGIDALQGYLLSRPRAIKDVLASGAN